MDSCRNTLLRGLAELKLNLDAAQIEKLLAFIKLIEKWNKAYNLTAVRDVQEMVSMHLLDSLAILPYIQGPSIADIGTGAGLPGIPLAICCPDYRFTLVDSNSKKTRFVQQAVLELQLKNVQVVHSRVESLKPQSLFATVISRAFASMADILRLTSHLQAEDGVLLAMKGQVPGEELAVLNQHYQVIAVKVPDVDAERCLIRLERSLHG